MRALVASLLCSAVVAAQTTYVPERVFDSAHREFTDFEMMLADVARADVVFVGEQHDDANTHALERAVLEGLARRRGSIVVGFEMFERDVQDPLDHFQMGHLDESEFLKSSRPWPNYRSDYKPLVDYAVQHNWPIFASNVPRALATEVSKTGLEALKTKSADESKWFAKDLQCPVGDDYFKRFAEAMGEHPAGDGKDAKERAASGRQSLERYYYAQCLKDETMGESVAQAFQTASTGGARPLIVHFNGAFHSDYAEGTAARTRRRLPGKRVVVLTMVPVTSLDGLAPSKDDRKRADYLVYTTAPSKE